MKHLSYNVSLKLNRKEVYKMNEKSKITLLEIDTGVLKDFIGYWSLKEVYQFCKNYGKSNKWKIKFIEFGIDE